MKKLFLLFFCALLTAIVAQAKELKIATYNVENLFDDKNNGNEYSEFKIGHSNWNSYQYHVKLKNISRVIKELNPDIIALQEVENYNVIKELAKTNGYDNYAFAAPKNSPVGVGILSKIKIVSTKSFHINSIKTRDILQANFIYENDSFSIFVNHFPAKKHSLRDRKYVASVLETAINGTKNSIILGDFNSEYGRDFLLNSIIDTQKFVDLWKFIAPFKRSSHISGRAIDHILLSKSFFDNNRFFYKDNSFKIYKPSYMESSYRSRSKSGKIDRYSDHFPIYCTIVFQNSTNNTSAVNSEYKTQESFNQENQKSISSDANKTAASPIRNIDFLYQKDEPGLPITLKHVVVVYVDKNGFVINDGSRGIYVFEKHSRVNLGNVFDMMVLEVGKYKGLKEIENFKIIKDYPYSISPKKYEIPISDLSKLRDGDIVAKISGDIKNGFFYTKFGKIRIYSRGKKLKNVNNVTFNSAFVGVYNANKELIVK